MEHWTFWEWVAYSGLWIASIILAADGGLKLYPNANPRSFQSLIARPLWAFAPLILMISSTIIILAHEFIPTMAYPPNLQGGKFEIADIKFFPPNVPRDPSAGPGFFSNIYLENMGLGEAPDSPTWALEQRRHQSVLLIKSVTFSMMYDNVSRGCCKHSASATTVRAMRNPPGRRPGPNGKCTICASAERARIEYGMARGASRNALAVKFDVSPDAIVRHWRNHVPEHVKAAALVKALKPGEDLQKLVTDESLGLLEHLQRIRAVLYDAFDGAAAAGDRAGVSSLAARLHSNLELAAKSTGELSQHIKTTSITNVILSPAYLELCVAGSWGRCARIRRPPRRLRRLSAQ